MTRLNPTDFAFLAYESAHPSVAAEIGALWQFSGAAPGLDELRAHLADRLPLLPALAGRLGPVGLLRPQWISDRPVDLNAHVHELAVDGATGLAGAVGEVLRRPLDRGAPLWEMWLLPDSAADGFAVLYKVHHSLNDGVSLSDIAQVLFSADRTCQPGSPPAPVPWTRRAARLLTGLGSMGADFIRLAPRSPLNRPHSGRRGLAWCVAPIEELATARSVEGSTINDVYLAALAGALRTWMVRHGDGPVPERLTALVPVSTRRPEEHGQLGNRLAAIRVPLPTSAADPVEKLAAVTRATARAKRLGQAQAAAAVVSGGRSLPAPLLRGQAELTFHPRLVNLIASGIPGPRQQLDLCGRPLTSFFAINYTPDRHAVSATMLSYRGQVFVAFAGDADLAGFDQIPSYWLTALRELADVSANIQR